MRIYEKVPEMLKWKKFFLTQFVILVFIVVVHSNAFLFYMSLVSLFFFAFLMALFVAAEYIMGDSRDLTFICKLHWHCVFVHKHSVGISQEWCKECTEHEWRCSFDSGCFIFKNEIDAMAFKLRWL